jgi:hypothetical protein
MAFNNNNNNKKFYDKTIKFLQKVKGFFPDRQDKKFEKCVIRKKEDE